MNNPKFIDETGNKYGKLTVIERAENTYLGTAKWLCQCECGNTRVCKGSALRRGEITHCGCEKKPQRITNYFKIKNMSIDEMAELILDFTNDECTCGYCKFYNDYLTTGVECNTDKCLQGVKHYLLQEVEE